MSILLSSLELANLQVEVVLKESWSRFEVILEYFLSSLEVVDLQVFLIVLIAGILEVLILENLFKDLSMSVNFPLSERILAYG